MLLGVFLGNWSHGAVSFTASHPSHSKPYDYSSNSTCFSFKNHLKNLMSGSERTEEENGDVYFSKYKHL